MSNKLIIKLCAVVMAVSGVTILGSTLYPIVSYEWEAAQKYPTLISPLVDETSGDFKFSDSDSSKLTSWFDEDRTRDFISQKVKYYTLSIPKLNIDNATVALGSENLRDNLIQYPGTAFPGKDGNAVIFGHSILPQYYDPTDYMAIFSTLPTLKKGDEIYADYDGVTYKYIVETMFEVMPTDTQILAQADNNSYMSLVTCSPPGHPLKPKRLIVRAKLYNPGVEGEQKISDSKI